ncbi:hypothetical protein EIP91_001175 [Steccherinum ochraceum]|uniref:NAD(P)-binding protein n=1 Tax=Steccherinum ochraceum TaxID=92696 RepID=A0A4V2MXP0_9APHY|nr:hypothetical protein EIP91_001175 [Steccherinum ochraceum]
MSLPLSGKVALVTGSSKGIGAAIARRLSTDGANVVVNYASSIQAAAEVVAEINSKDAGNAIAIHADLTSIIEGKRLVDETIKAFGGLDILVLNAAVMENRLLADITEELYDKHYNTNVKVPLFMVQHAAPFVKEGGRIIFCSSSLTMNTAVPPNSVLYVSTKGAIEQIIRVLAKDLGTRGVTVNAVAPGATDTELFRNGKSEQILQAHRERHPAKRLGQPDDIAPAVAFLASEQAQWVNGQTWFVNGDADITTRSASCIGEGKRLIDDSVKAFGQLDVLVLNAGIMEYAALSAIDEAAYDKHYDTNVKVPLFMTQHAAPLLKEGGRILFFSTSLAINTSVPPNYVLYVSTKGAVEQIVRVLSKDLGTRGITVNAIAPGPTDTDLFRNGKNDQLIQMFANGHPMKRLAVPDDIAPAVAFLASEQSRWINGQTWYINGGYNV